jgi:hypothetical protein
MGFGKELILHPKTGGQQKETPNVGGALARASGSALSKSGSNLPARPDDRLLKIAEEQKARMQQIDFIIDATASRSGNWHDSQRVQAEMFDTVSREAGHLKMGIYYHRGSQAAKLGIFDNAEAARNAMSEVYCISGTTDIATAMEMSGGQGDLPGCVILVGDCCEDDEERVYGAARQLADKKVPVYAIHDRSSGGSEADAMRFRRIAEITNGAFLEFGDMREFSSICKAIAVRQTGGVTAFKKLLESGDSGAKKLAQANPRLMLGPGGR